MDTKTKTEVILMDEVYNAGRRDADLAKADLLDDRMDFEAVGKIKAAEFNLVTNKLLKYVTLYQIKTRKDHRKAGRTWVEFCESIGESKRSVDRILTELAPILQRIPAKQSEILGMPLHKIRFLGRSITADLAEISDNALVIGDHRIEIIPENKEELEAALDLFKEDQENERAKYEKELKKLQKKLDGAVSEETKALKAERDTLAKEVVRLKVFDPEDKPVEWSIEQIKEVDSRCAEFVASCGRFIMDGRLDEHIELQAKIEGVMTHAEMALAELRKLWDERFNCGFGEDGQI